MIEMKYTVSINTLQKAQALIDTLRKDGCLDEEIFDTLTDEDTRSEFPCNEAHIVADLALEILAKEHE